MVGVSALLLPFLGGLKRDWWMRDVDWKFFFLLLFFLNEGAECEVLALNMPRGEL